VPDSFANFVGRAVRGPLSRGAVTTLQLNIGSRCDLACRHCHVEAGPLRSEAMGRRGAERILELLACNEGIELLDITGGAPELNPEFRFLVRGARALGRRVIDRSNLTVFFEPGQEETPEFLAEQGAEVVASLPCYTAETVEQQRGRGVFDKSIAALRRLNRLGYAGPGSELRLHLVYNPAGASLPPSQSELEARFRQELRSLFGIEFSGLYTLTNMPIKRFARDLELEGRAEAYMSLLVEHFNPDTLDQLMCRSMVSVGYDGTLYDCDFNQALEIPLPQASGRPLTIWDLSDLSQLRGHAIATGRHCFGCTAAAGSSCGGALANGAPGD
jgi:radical SAM/Cys-rich protein